MAFYAISHFNNRLLLCFFFSPNAVSTWQLITSFFPNSCDIGLLRLSRLVFKNRTVDIDVHKSCVRFQIEFFHNYLYLIVCYFLQFNVFLLSMLCFIQRLQGHSFFAYWEMTECNSTLPIADHA